MCIGKWRILALVLLLAAGGCREFYAERDHWVLYDFGGGGQEDLYDVFYVYPTLTNSHDHPYLDPADPATARKVRNFAGAQAGILSSGRAYSPFVRQLEFGRCIELLHGDFCAIGESPQLRPGIADTVSALRYFHRNIHQPGRPFLLFGHSQGAQDIYYALKELPEVISDPDFAAAYLPGLPKLTPDDLARDFPDGRLKLAERADDTGVLIVWHTQRDGAVNPAFTVENACNVNPLNWSSTEIPAENADNLSTFYDYRTGSVKIVEGLPGEARIDSKQGALIVDLPPNSEYDAGGLLGEGVFHVSDVWLFAGVLNDNARLRAKRTVDRKKR